MTSLVPMGPELFDDFLDEAVTSYALDNVASGRWSTDEASARSRAEFDRLLPQGLQTPDNHLYEIRDEATGTTVGTLWFAVTGSGAARSAYVFNVRVLPEHRRRGHARAAFAALEAIAVELGLVSIGLHVFAHNPGAQKLYASLGYGITGFSMRKPMQGGDAR